jgi:cytochrome c-type biogenesis protein
VPSQILNLLLAFGAGGLTILSPCVLPLVPVVLGSAAQQHRWGPAALAAGLVVSFTSVGLILGAFGSRLEVDPDQVRMVGAVILAAAGVFLLVPVLQDRTARLAAPLVDWAGDRQQRFHDKGLYGQTAIGVLLGVVWSPCVGPTLGAAIALAAQGQQLSQVAATMAAFATGISSVLLIISFLGRTAFNSIRGDLTMKGKIGKLVLGSMLLLVGVLILTGFDRALEGVFVSSFPDWLINLTTRL